MLAFTCTRISNFGSGVETRLRRVQPLVTAHGAREYVCVCVCVCLCLRLCVYVRVRPAKTNSLHISSIRTLGHKPLVLQTISGVRPHSQKFTNGESRVSSGF